VGAVGGLFTAEENMKSLFYVLVGIFAAWTAFAWLVFFASNTQHGIEYAILGVPFGIILLLTRPQP
jgi:hypothetical protein